MVRWAVGAALSLMLVALPAWADVLELKDGRVLRGTYMGGTQGTVRFMVADKVELFTRADIVALTFSEGSGTYDRLQGATTPVRRPAETPASTPAPQPAPQPSITPAPAAAQPAPSTPARTSLNDVTVPAGTRILVRMIDSVDSDTNKVGDRFRASLEEDLTADGRVVARKGTDVYGRLVEVKEAGRIAGRSELRLQLTDILINQQLHPIVTGDYDIAGEGRGGESAKRIGAGAAVGAVVGAIAGGGKGAAIGAGVGAAAGTTIQVLTRGEQVRVPSETLLEFRIEHAFTVRINP
ncbi:MAG TPA: hypothetical protein VGA40_02720 [Candidatus Acidoferrales bacterium]